MNKSGNAEKNWVALEFLYLPKLGSLEPQHAACEKAGAPQEQSSTGRKNPFLILQRDSLQQKLRNAKLPVGFCPLKTMESQGMIRSSSCLYKYCSNGVREILVCEWQNIFPAGILASGLTFPIPTPQKGSAK